MIPQRTRTCGILPCGRCAARFLLRDFRRLDGLGACGFAAEPLFRLCVFTISVLRYADAMQLKDLIDVLGTIAMLADAVGIGERQPLKMIEPKSRQHKLIVFVPENALDKVSSALFAAGAGQIGKYSSCSFQSKGEGTFYGEEGTNPAVGQAGKLERAAEVRLETVIPISRVDAIVRALREAHPYEEPAFDLVPLAAQPEGVGMGR